jgi:hypothetical protein
MAPNYFRRDPPHRAGGARRPAVATRPPATPAVPAPSPARSSNFLRVAMLTAVLSGLMVYVAPRLAPFWARQVEAQLAARELAELESLQTFQLSARFDEWLARENLGLAWTVHALTSERPGVSYHAEQALLREMESWPLRRSPESVARMLQLARALQAHAAAVPAARRPTVRRLIERMATWPVAETKLAGDLVAYCDSILSQLPPASPDELQLALSDAQADRRLAMSLESTAPAVPLPAAPEELKAPLELTPPPELPAEETEPQPKAPKKVPKRFFAPRAQELPGDDDPAESTLLPPITATAKRNLNDWVRELGDLEVMRLLHHGDYGVRYTAERELDRRGYQSEHLSLAKLLVHPDPRERRKLVEQLPRVTNVDPKPWLLQLSEDEDAGVRRAAEGILQASRPGQGIRK